MHGTKLVAIAQTSLKCGGVRDKTGSVNESQYVDDQLFREI